MLLFIERFNVTGGKPENNPASPRRVYIDQVSWL